MHWFSTLRTLVRGPQYRGPVSDHFDGRQFVGPLGNRRLSGRQIWQLLREMPREPWPRPFPTPTQTVPPPPEHGGRVVYINHSTVLLQLPGVSLLTDPIWSEHAGPYGRIGPRRVTNPGVRFADLPRIDVVLLSHDHYDHLDMPTLHRLVGRDRPLVLCGLGVRRFLIGEGIGQVCELDWWQGTDLPAGVRAIFAPAQHFSGRSLRDRYTTLWGSYVLQTPVGLLYFGGDSAYAGHYREIARRFGPPLLALLPIGAYHPPELMRQVHMSPEEAVQAHVDLGAVQSVAIHHGTFRLTLEGYHEPPARLAAELQRRGLPPESFVVLPNGGMLEFGSR